MLAELQSDSLKRGRLGWELELAGDAAAHRFLMKALAAARPDDAVLSEEGRDDRSRVNQHRAWIVDPLDGSNGFGEGNGEWAVHVALVEGGAPTAGAVTAPALGLIASTLNPSPHRAETASNAAPVVAMGRSRAWRDGQLVIDAIDGDLIVCGSAGVKALLVIHGQADVYVHDSPLYEWDVCAPMVVAQASGLHVSDCRGQDLHFNKPDPVVSSLMISRSELAQDVANTLKM